MAYQEKKYLQKTQGICLLQRISFSRVIKWNFEVSKEWTNIWNDRRQNWCQGAEFQERVLKKCECLGRGGNWFASKANSCFKYPIGYLKQEGQTLTYQSWLRQQVQHWQAANPGQATGAHWHGQHGLSLLKYSWVLFLCKFYMYMYMYIFQDVCIT